MIILYDTLGDVWKSNIGPNINSIPSAAFTASIDSDTGDLVVVNDATQEDAGGLVSDQIPLPANMTYFGLDVIFDLSQIDLNHFFRGENDLKITFPGGAQANVSTEWNKTTGDWQLDPTGKGWVSTGFKVSPAAGRNKWQVRATFDGKLWSVTKLCFNGEEFLPDSRFQNLPAIQTNWTPGLHPQLQTEVTHAPFYLREEYERVRVIAADTEIPWTFD